MIICFQQGGINLTALDPGAAHNWLPLQTCGLIFRSGGFMPQRDTQRVVRTAEDTTLFSGDLRKKRLGISNRSSPGQLSIKQSIKICNHKSKKKIRNSIQQILKRCSFFKESVIFIQFYMNHQFMKTSMTSKLKKKDFSAYKQGMTLTRTIFKLYKLIFKKSSLVCIVYKNLISKYYFPQNWTCKEILLVFFLCALFNLEYFYKNKFM